MIRRTPLKRGTKPLKRTPLRKVSKKRAKDGKIYSAKRKAFLALHPFCEVELKEYGITQSEAIEIQGKFSIYDECKGFSTVLISPATDIHHTAKRTGKNYLDESTWLAVCRENHEMIHANPSWARANGFLK